MNLPYILMHQHIQANKDIYTLKYLKQFQHPSQSTSTSIREISNFIRQSSSDIFIQDTKLLARIMNYYLKRNSTSCSKTPQPHIDQLIGNLKKKNKEMPKIKPALLSYLLSTTIRNFTSGAGQPTTIQYEQMKKMDTSQNHTPSLTYFNYTHQQQTPNVLKATNQICLKIAQNIYQPPNPNCLGCSEYFYQDYHTQSTRLSEYSTLPEGHVIKDTRQFCMAVCYTDNSIFEQELSKAFAVGLSYGGGYVFVTNENSQKICGIQQNNYTIQNIYQKIIASLSSIRPPLCKQSYSIKKLYVFPNFLSQISQISENSHEHQPVKFILKIRLKPVKNRMYYSEHKITPNKFSHIVHHKLNNKILQIHSENIYEQIIKKYQNKQTDKKTLSCPTCAITAYPQFDLTSLKNNEETLNNKETVEYDDTSQQPIFKYKNYAILAISSNKYEADLIIKIRKEFEARKIYITLNKPHTKYTTLAQRRVWFISHECQFNTLNKIIQAVDQQSKATAIIVTKFLQINNTVEKQKVKRMKSALKHVYSTQQVRQQERYEFISSKSSKQIKFTYFGFEEFKHSIFGYIYLDSTGEKGISFVKEYHFKNEHKGKK